MSKLFTLEDGIISIPRIGLFLDSKKRKEFGYISHGHSDHIARHQKILCTDKTAQLLKYKLKNTNFYTLPFFESSNFYNLSITLFPAGHILGSSQIFIESSEGSLLYTGDFHTKESRINEKFVFQKCDTLIMETTFGMPHYCFPPREEVEEELITLLKMKLEKGIVPVVFVYTLGKSHEILHLLGNSDLPVAVDYSILRYAGVYEKFGIDFGKYEKFRKSEFRDKVLLIPANFRRHKYFQRLGNKYTIYLSGWGMDQSARFRLGVDEVLPYSDHADFNELIEFVEKISPKEVYCTHGFDQFVTILRNKGFNAKLLHPSSQLDLFD